MAWSMYSLTSIVVNLIDKNNTTTSSLDVSSGLTERVKLIRRGKYDITPIPNTQYPCVFVRVRSKDSDIFEKLGQCNNKRDQYANVEIVPIVMAGTHYDSEKEMYNLTSNIEALLRAKISLSSTVNDALITGVDYDATPIDDEFHNIYSIINVRVHKLSD